MVQPGERAGQGIVGWHASTVKGTAMVTAALKMTLWRRDHGGHRVGDGLIHHGDAGSQCASIVFMEMLVVEGITDSIGTVAGAYDNALAESTIGLFKTEAISKSRPFLQDPIKTIDDIEFFGRWSGWIGSIPVPCVAPWTTSLPASSRRSITLNYRFSSRRCRQHRSGKKPGTVQQVRRIYPYFYDDDSGQNSVVGTSISWLWLNESKISCTLGQI